MSGVQAEGITRSEPATFSIP